MRDAKNGGSIINISSIAALNRGQLPGGVAYVSSKSGLSAMTKVMALELGAYNIRANAIAPGLFKSEITSGLMQKDWLNTVAQRTCPMRTFGTSDPALTSLVQPCRVSPFSLPFESLLRYWFSWVIHHVIPSTSQNSVCGIALEF
ncbi:unnamed protein product, partial [Vitis vinifera]